MLAHSLGRSCLRWAAPSLFLAAATSLLPAPASACSWVQVVIEASYPTPDAVEVPTNAVLFVYGPLLTATDSVELVDDRGEVVPVEVRAVLPSGLDVEPLAELNPERRYVLRTLGPNASGSVAFTTGVGPAEVPDSLSAPELDVAVFSYALGSCGVLSGLCVEAPASPDTTLEVRIGEEVLGAGAGAPWPLSRAYSQALAESDCVEVRARDVRGHRSAPSTACGEAVRRFQLRTDFEAQYNCDNYLDYVGGAAPEPEAATPGATPVVVQPVVGDSPLPENASAPRDVSYVAGSVDMGSLTGSDTVIYDEEPSVRSSNGCALANPGAGLSGTPFSKTGRPGGAWLRFGLAVAPLLGAALLGARRRS